MKIEKHVKQFELTEWLHEPIQNLSKGMKQKVEIIRTIMTDPPILLLDEPFSGLDYNATNVVVNLLKNLLKNKNTSIILTTHKITIAKQICDNLLILKSGKLTHKLGENEIKSSPLEIYF
jgi:ABC-type multidrug transport system ATPase subunit